MAVELTVRGVCGREAARVEELVLLLLLDVRDGEGDGEGEGDVNCHIRPLDRAAVVAIDGTPVVAVVVAVEVVSRVAVDVAVDVGGRCRCRCRCRRGGEDLRLRVRRGT